VCQLRTHAPCAVARLFDHLVGASEQGDREGESECLSCLEIQDQLDLSGLLDRQIGWGVGRKQQRVRSVLRGVPLSRVALRSL
jgi:hypothetical protein